MESIWTKTSEHGRARELNQEIKTDVLIIGGGITGILCAYMLRKAGVDCVLVEARRLCSGTTKNTTAKLTYQHGLIYDKIIAGYGRDTARLYLAAQREALDKYKELASGVSCDFEERDFFVYSLDRRDKIEKEIKALEKIGGNAQFVEALPLPFPVEGAICIKNQAQFNPLKLLFNLAKGITVYENTKVLEYKPGCAITNRGKIQAEKIIVTTHFPLFNKHGGYFVKMYQHRSYAIAYKGVPGIRDMYVDEAKKGFSFRDYNDMVIIGGGSHRTGKKGGSWQEISDFARKYYPKATEVCRWATQDCMTLDGIPYIGQYSKSTPFLYVATGFNKWGMTSAMAAADILTDLVCEKENKYSAVFSPSRSIIHPQLAINTAHSLAGLLTLTTPRCPHMGCALKYNRREHSWDCPCHGSRFTETGQVIDNPATGDIKD